MLTSFESQKRRRLDIQEFTGFQDPVNAAIFYTTDHLMRILIVSCLVASSYGTVSRLGFDLDTNMQGRILEVLFILSTLGELPNTEVVNGLTKFT